MYINLHSSLPLPYRLFMKGTFGAFISVIQLFIFERESVYALFSEDGSSCDVSFRMMMFAAHVTTRGLDVAGEMTFLFVSEAGKHCDHVVSVFIQPFCFFFFSHTIYSFLLVVLQHCSTSYFYPATYTPPSLM